MHVTLTDLSDFIKAAHPCVLQKITEARREGIQVLECGRSMWSSKAAGMHAQRMVMGALQIQTSNSARTKRHPSDQVVIQQLKDYGIGEKMEISNSKQVAMLGGFLLDLYSPLTCWTTSFPSGPKPCTLRTASPLQPVRANIHPHHASFSRTDRKGGHSP